MKKLLLFISVILFVICSNVWGQWMEILHIGKLTLDYENEEGKNFELIIEVQPQDYVQVVTCVLKNSKNEPIKVAEYHIHKEQRYKTFNFRRVKEKVKTYECDISKLLDRYK